MDDADVRGLMDACGCGRYPQGFLDDYEPFECLANHEDCETLLVKNKRTGMFYVAKCYAAAHMAGHATETEILKKLQRAGLPRFVDEYKSDEMRCVIREYVEGTPLHQLPGRPDARRAAQIALSLCELLIYLHGQTPPIIHRDIKPQNLIMGADGQLWLIDFGISRLFQAEAEADTACWGTQDFAAPEQYGYAQTDVRSDLYSFGILLGWLLTGEAKREAALPKIADRGLKQIVKKCTAFAPGDRYASAARVRADLLALDGRRLRRLLRKLCAAALCALCLCAGFTVGRYTDWLSPRAVGVTFAEPLIEQAVRKSLRLANGAAITEAELLSVTELFVCGDQPAQDGQTYQALIEESATKKPVRNGGIDALSDLLMMPNLSGVYLSLQNIDDLSPL
ncbi:MAG: protein kinase, partial [Bacillota bacterium]